MTDRIERELWLPVPPEEVWDVVTSDGWLADEVRLDLRPGGEASFRSRDALKTGWIEEIRAPAAGSADAARLTFWWAADGEPATRVELTILPEHPATARLRVIETRPLETLDLVGLPLLRIGGATFGPALVAA